MTADDPVTDGRPSVEPSAMQAAAERVRRHLVALRGGAPFLAPDDSALLVDWLAAGVTPARIAVALEATAARRHARRERGPLRLSHARRLLTSAPPIVVAEPPVAWGVTSHPLDDLRALRAPFPELAALLHAAVETVTALPADDIAALADAALDAVSTFWDDAWLALHDDHRATLHARAVATLAEVAYLLDEATLVTLTEEHARAHLRDTLPALSATTLLRRLLP